MSDSAQRAGKLARAGWWIVLAAVVPAAAWMTFAPLSIAVVAPALVKVDLNRRPVQHLEGGIVRAVLVRDGEKVKAGDPVLLLGDVSVDADRNRVEYRVRVEQASLARLEAERSLAHKLRFNAELEAFARQDERVREALTKELDLFRARRSSLESKIALISEQREHVKREIAALHAQISQAQNALALQRKDFEANRGLVQGGYISPARLAQIEAAVVDYAAKLEERRSELARAEQRLVDAEFRISSLRHEYVQQASDEVTATAARLADLEQELRKTTDAAKRQVVAAPASGEVIDLRFTSPGAVVRPGEPIAEIVPTDVRLLIEAHIRPEDIGHVHVGQLARVRFTAFKYRSTALARGHVSYVSADRLTDRMTNMPYYSVTIEVDEAQEAEDMKVQAGMPAEAYIEGNKQTPLQYLLEPITSTIRKAGRQM